MLVFYTPLARYRSPSESLFTESRPNEHFTIGSFRDEGGQNIADHSFAPLEAAFASTDQEMVRLLAEHDAGLKGPRDRVVFHALFGSIFPELFYPAMPAADDRRPYFYFSIKVKTQEYQARKQLVEELLAGPFKENNDIFYKDSKGMNSLHHISQQKSIDPVQLIPYLVSLGFDLDERDKSSKTAMHLAAQSENGAAF